MEMPVRIGRRKLIVMLLGASTSAGAVVAWSAGGTSAFVAVLLMASIGSVILLGYFVAQVERRLRISNARQAAYNQTEMLSLKRELHGTKQELQSITQTVDTSGQTIQRIGQAVDGISTREVPAFTTRLASIEGRSDRLREAVESLQVRTEQLTDEISSRLEQPGVHAERLLRAVNSAHKRIELKQGRMLEKASKEREKIAKAGESSSREAFRQAESLIALYVDTKASAGFPATRSWVAAPDLLHYLHRTVERNKPDLVLECGSGLSTVVLAYALRANGHGKVVALEHLDEYARRTSDLLVRHGVEAWAEVRLAPLEPVKIDEEEWLWYSPSKLPDDTIDLLFVDGPPRQTREHARFPAVPLLIDRLSADGLIILDDFGRQEEAEIAERWTTRHPKLTQETLRHEKGTAVLRQGTE